MLIDNNILIKDDCYSICHRLKRPLSGSHFHRRSMPLNPRVPTSMDLDLAVQRKNHPILYEEQEEVEEEVDYSLPVVAADVTTTEEDDTPLESEESSDSIDDDDFTKSSKYCFK